MKTSLTSVIKESSFYLTNFFPLAFCIAICFDFNIITAILFSSISIMFMPESAYQKSMPLIISFLILGNNPENSLGASIICCVLLIISSLFFDKIKSVFQSFNNSGVMLAGALTATVLFTTDYFGIGATGNSITEMIKSYVSLGFHPNWRGVLYGTIVLVIMITFPRKFKKLNKYVSASFIALILTLILNIFLNPADMNSAITELSQGSLSLLKNHILIRTHINFDFKTVIIGFALFILFSDSVISLEKNKKTDSISYGIFNIFNTGIIGFPLPYFPFNIFSSIVPRLIAVAITVISFLLFDDVFIRIPFHSCAVVIIVSAWNSVIWKNINTSFLNLKSVILFIVPLIICMITDISIGLIVSLIASILFNNIKKTEAC